LPTGHSRHDDDHNEPVKHKSLQLPDKQNNKKQPKTSRKNTRVMENHGPRDDDVVDGDNGDDSVTVQSIQSVAARTTTTVRIVTVHQPIETRPSHYGKLVFVLTYMTYLLLNVMRLTDFVCCVASVYPVVVRDQYIQWEVRRCFKQIRQLHSSLEGMKELLTTTTLPQLPPKLSNTSLLVTNRLTSLFCSRSSTD